MQEEIQAEEEIRLSDIFRAIWTKIWLIVAVLFAGAAVGMAFGFAKYHDVHYYGAKTEYYVSSTGKDNEEANGQIYQTYKEEILKQIQALLASERFTRMLMADLPEAQGIEYDTEKYDDFLKMMNKSVSYTYTVGTNVIAAKVSVLNNPTLAKNLLEQIRTKLPDFVKNMLGEGTFGTTVCEQINFARSGLLNEGQTKKEMIKFGAIIGLAAAIVACVVVVVVDRTDNRLRDYEAIPQKFKVPVLGVIPRIDTIADDKGNKTSQEAVK